MLMQYLKDHLRERILKAAVDEFYEKGFEGSSIRNIADGANTSPGNIYRYYKNKRSLIDGIYQPIEDRIAEIILEENSMHRHGYDTKDIVARITLLIETYYKEFYILATTNLADETKHSLIELIKKRQLSKEKDEDYAHFKAMLVFEGILIIVRNHFDDLEKAKKYFKSLIYMLFQGKDPDTASY